MAVGKYEKASFSCGNFNTNDAAWLQSESTCAAIAYPRDSGTYAIPYIGRDSNSNPVTSNANHSFTSHINPYADYYAHSIANTDSAANADPLCRPSF